MKDMAMKESSPDMMDSEAKCAADTVLQAHKHMQDPAMRNRMKKHLTSHKKAVDSAMAGMPNDGDGMDPETAADVASEKPSSLKALKAIRNKKIGKIV